MLFLAHVVVVAGDSRTERDRREEPAQDIRVQTQHDGPVGGRVLLRPEQVVPVGLHRGRAGEEDGKVAVGQIRVVGKIARDRHVVLGQLLADVARPGVQHEPHRVRGVQAELDEVVPAAQRAQLGPGLVPPVRHGGAELVEASPQRELVNILRDLGMRGEPDGDRLLDRAAQRS